MLVFTLNSEEFLPTYRAAFCVELRIPRSEARSHESLRKSKPNSLMSKVKFLDYFRISSWGKNYFFRESLSYRLESIALVNRRQSECMHNRIRRPHRLAYDTSIHL